MTKRPTNWSAPTAAPSPMVGPLHELAVITTRGCVARLSYTVRPATTGLPEPGATSWSPPWNLGGEGLFRKNPTMTVMGTVTSGKSRGKTLALALMLELDRKRTGRRLVVLDEVSAVEPFDLSALRRTFTRGQGW